MLLGTAGRPHECWRLSAAPQGVLGTFPPLLSLTHVQPRHWICSGHVPRGSRLPAALQQHLAVRHSCEPRSRALRAWQCRPVRRPGFPAACTHHLWEVQQLGEEDLASDAVARVGVTKLDLHALDSHCRPLPERAVHRPAPEVVGMGVG